MALCVYAPVKKAYNKYIESGADNCEVFNLNIMITADTATHTQTIAMTYLPADYTKVDAAIAKANALNKDNYKDFSGVEATVKAVVRGKNITEQPEVDKMAKAIEDAIAALQYKDADKITPTPSATPTPTPVATVTPQSTLPQTGDTNNPALLVVLMLVSGSAAIGTAVIGSKKKNNR